MESLIKPDDHVLLWALIAAGTAASIWLEQRYRWAARLSGPVIGLLIAMLLSNCFVMPPASDAYDFVGDWIVPLAIPLLLFRANLREIIRVSGRLFLVFHLSALGTILGVVVAVLALNGVIGSPDTAHAAGMMGASYMGGGVNFMAVKTSYEVGDNLSGPLIVADNFVMAACFIMLLGMAASRWFRARYPHPHSQDLDPTAARNLAAEHWTRKGISLLDVAKSVAFAFAAVAIAHLLQRGMAWIFATAIPWLWARLFGAPLDPGMAYDVLGVFCTNQFVLLTLVSLVLATVFAKPLEHVNGPEEFGAYFLYVFLFTLGLPANLLVLFREAPVFLAFCGIIAVTNILVTFLAGRLLKLNLEELVIAVNANLGGPPSAAAMAISAGWPRLVLPGILVGIWGYVVGTPVGILIVEVMTR